MGKTQQQPLFSYSNGIQPTRGGSTNSIAAQTDNDSNQDGQFLNFHALCYSKPNYLVKIAPTSQKGPSIVHQIPNT